MEDGGGGADRFCRRPSAAEAASSASEVAQFMPPAAVVAPHASTGSHMLHSSGAFILASYTFLLSAIRVKFATFAYLCTKS